MQKHIKYVVGVGLLAIIAFLLAIAASSESDTIKGQIVLGIGCTSVGTLIIVRSIKTKKLFLINRFKIVGIKMKSEISPIYIMALISTLVWGFILTLVGIAAIVSLILTISGH